MNQLHLELCSSAEWAETVRRYIIPDVLDGLELGDDVLEIGPGPGRTTEVLVELVAKLTAVEFDPALASSLGQRLARPGFEVLHADATALPHADRAFSAVLSFTMLHHLPDPGAQDRVFAEAARVLRPGGVFAGIDSKDSPEFRNLHVEDVCVPIDPSTLAERLERAGFVGVEVFTNEHRTRFRAWRPA